ncbi:ileal sodium/bile acid cotransporter-like [Ptychodera flava]|uniref:ileal sodium/bile acid cotransporter-like n=1 Tax=Ptychodera flava TaxID=63121 RepID=UPI00396AB0F9
MDTTTMEAALNDSNETAGHIPPKALIIANQVNINTLLVLIMLAMGCTMTVQDIKQILVKPVAITVGALCQFGIMPTLGFAYAHLFKLSPNMAIGTVIISCCPGGLASNFFTYWTEGDITLSVCMTTASNILGIGMMPWCIYLYSQSWANLSTTILPPARDIVISLLILLIPAAIGMLIRWKHPKFAIKFAFGLNLFMNVGFIIFVVLNVLAFLPTFQSSWRPYAVASLYPFTAFAAGYFIAWIFRRNKHQCRTIAFETGIQNSALALSLINLLILQNEGASGRLSEMIIVPMLHGILALAEGFLIIGVYWFYKKVILKEEGFLKEHKERMAKARLDEFKPAKMKYDTDFMDPAKTAQMEDKDAQTDFPDDGYYY